MLKKVDKKKLRVLRVIKDNNLDPLLRIFLSSALLVFFFYSLPFLIKFTNNEILNTEEFQNKSKAVLAYTLNKKNNSSNENQALNERDLLIDIFSLNDLETDSVRLDASTIKQLFEDTDYRLDEVRKKKN